MRLKTRLLSVSIMTAISTAAILPATMAFAQDAPASAQQTVRLDIPAGPASAGLNLLATQADVQLFYPFSLVSGRTVPALRGEYPREEAIRMVVESAGLAVAKQEGDTYALRDPQASSADGGADGNAVDALIVTAQKREQAIQDVPIAISAFSQKALEEQKIEGGFDLLKAIPNVTFSKNNFTSYNFSIRGIGTKAISPTTDPGVAVEFNDTPLIRNRLFEQEYFDVQRVEVLRGPQGTLHGRNATSGVINVISAKPKLGELEASVKLEGGNYNTQRAVGMLNIPLVEDVLGVRFAASMTKRDGYGINLFNNEDVDGRDLWSARTTIGFEPNERIRADLIWERFEEDDNRQRTSKQLCTHDAGPTRVGAAELYVDPSGFGATTAQVRGQFSQGCLPGSLYADAAFGTPNGFAIPFINVLATANAGSLGFYPFSLGGHQATVIDRGVDPYGNTTQSRDLRAIYSKVPTTYRASADLLELNISFDVTDTLTLTSQTAYDKDEIYATQDFNRYTTFRAFPDSSVVVTGAGDPSAYRPLMPGGVFCDPQLGCANTIVGQDLSQATSEQFSQEIRLQSDFDGAFNFSFGGNYLQYETVEDYYVFFNGITLVSIVAINANGLGGTPSADRLTIDPDCSVAATPPPGSLPPFLGIVYCVPIETNSIANIQDYGHNYFLSRNPYELKSKSLFGELYWKPTDTLNFTFGLRYSDDKKTFTPIPSQTVLTPRDFPGLVGSGFEAAVVATALIGTGYGYPAEPDIIRDWQEISGRVGFDWKPVLSFTDSTMLYAFFSRGYKGGGMNPPPIGLNYEEAEAFGNIFPLSAPREFRPEFVNAYEIGAKNTLLGGGLVLNLGAFYYDYKDYQVSKISDRQAVNENFDAQIWGLEFESVFSPTRNLRFNASLGYLDTKLADGSQSIDLMDRTAGHDDWILVKPTVTLPSNCIIPVWVAEALAANSSDLLPLEQACPGGGFDGRNFTGTGPPFGGFLPGGLTYNPADHPEANYGAGFFADVSGNELPNAPHWTVMVGSQYEVGLPGGWDATVRGDFYWQSQSYHRVYGTQYDKLRAWTNVNLSLWLEKADWGVKAEVYVKNVLDATPITDAFLNSDDSALTTNIFTLDPRLIGVSFRKDF